jgi:hypothetical protein
VGCAQSSEHGVGGWHLFHDELHHGDEEVPVVEHCDTLVERGTDTILLLRNWVYNVFKWCGCACHD